jgi:hypothetical protein
MCQVLEVLILLPCGPAQNCEEHGGEEDQAEPGHNDSQRHAPSLPAIAGGTMTST